MHCRAGIMYATDAGEPMLKSNMFSLGGSKFFGAVNRSINLGGQTALALRLLLAVFSSKISSSANRPFGEEFRAARKVSEDLGAQLVLGDRPIEITLERAWKSLSWDEKTKLLVSLFRGITSTTETAQDEKAAGSPYDLYEKLSISYPSLLQPLIHERDMFLAWSLKRSKAVNKSKTVVGIIGKGHMNGVVYALISDQGDLRFRDLVGRASSDTWASSLIKGLPRHVTQRVRHVVEANRLLRADLLPLSVSAIAVNFLSLSTTRFICHPNSKLTATIADNLDHIAADFFKTNTWGRL
uniref:TraB domain-containing protein n=1 Tax=Leersia perrieri TaxID=77586 RepID=A0A0D9XAG6_9ORYZ